MLGQIQRTQFDLRFPLFGIQVNVHPLFWLVSAIMGWTTQYWEGHEVGKPEYIVLWVACVFISILVHEFGHALIARAFGYQPEVYLYTFGGLAAYHPGHNHTPLKSIAISFAGPAAGFLLCGLVFLASIILAFQNIHFYNYIEFVIVQMVFINLAWGLVNLLPVLPLDGGHICEAAFDFLLPHKSKGWTAVISMVVSGLTAFAFFRFGARYAGFLFAYLCYLNFNNYQIAKRGYW